MLTLCSGAVRSALRGVALPGREPRGDLLQHPAQRLLLPGRLLRRHQPGSQGLHQHAAYRRPGVSYTTIYRSSDTVTLCLYPMHS